VYVATRSIFFPSLVALETASAFEVYQTKEPAKAFVVRHIHPINIEAAIIVFFNMPCAFFIIIIPAYTSIAKFCVFDIDLVMVLGKEIGV
jgi:hypothetical protein